MYLVIGIRLFYISTVAQVAPEQVKGVENVAYQWGRMVLDATANDTEKFNQRPTVTSRYLGLIFKAVFDAWTRYDENTIPVYLEDINRVEQDQRTVSNKEKAISYAAYRTLSEYYFIDIAMY